MYFSVSESQMGGMHVAVVPDRVAVGHLAVVPVSDLREEDLRERTGVAARGVEGRLRRRLLLVRPADVGGRGVLELRWRAHGEHQDCRPLVAAATALPPPARASRPARLPAGMLRSPLLGEPVYRLPAARNELHPVELAVLVLAGVLVPGAPVLPDVLPLVGGEPRLADDLLLVGAAELPEYVRPAAAPHVEVRGLVLEHRHGDEIIG